MLSGFTSSIAFKRQNYQYPQDALAKPLFSVYSFFHVVAVPHLVGSPVNDGQEVRYMPSLAHYMAQYDHEHGSAWNKLLHGIGIPMIFAGLILFVLLKWAWGAGFFVGGWVLLFLGHKIEGNHPAFFQGPIYLLVGPIWVAKEFWMFVTGSHRKQPSQGTPQSDALK